MRIGGSCSTKTCFVASVAMPCLFWMDTVSMAERACKASSIVRTCCGWMSSCRHRHSSTLAESGLPDALRTERNLPPKTAVMADSVLLVVRVTTGRFFLPTSCHSSPPELGPVSFPVPGSTPSVQPSSFPAGSSTSEPSPSKLDRAQSSS